MIGRARSLFAALMLTLSAAGIATAASAQVQQADATASRSQILVMLRLAEQHYRPNSHYSGGYGDDVHRNARRRLAARIARSYGLELVDNWPMPMLGVDCFIMAVTDGRTTDEAAEQVSHDVAVAWSQPLQLYRAQGTSLRGRDPLFPLQPAAREWRLADLHRIATGRGITVAVIDSRIESGHPDLLGQVAISKDFVGGALAAEQHGTGVAGVIAAIADNGVGIAGVAPRARLMGLRACWQDGEQASPPMATVCDSLSLAKALYFAIEHKARIINMSLSGPQDLLLAKLLQIGVARGIVIVAAFNPKLPRGGFPASQPGVIAVSDRSLPAPLSGVYTAPGQDVPTTRSGGRWYLVNGSSYAAAHVSGVVALLRERAASKRGSPSFVSARAGGGAINACATLIRAAKPCDCSCPDTPQVAAEHR